jgi:hypothetical protein
MLLRTHHPERALELAETARERFRQLGARPNERAATRLIEELGDGRVAATRSA